jgi:hypothetical protein
VFTRSHLRDNPHRDRLSDVRQQLRTASCGQPVDDDLEMPLFVGTALKCTKFSQQRIQKSPRWARTYAGSLTRRVRRDTMRSISFTKLQHSGELDRAQAVRCLLCGQ